MIPEPISFVAIDSDEAITICQFLGCRNAYLEKLISESEWSSTDYALVCLHDRFILGEPAIFQRSSAKLEYVTGLPVEQFKDVFEDEEFLIMKLKYNDDQIQSLIINELTFRHRLV